MEIILGSTSQHRKKILERSDLIFEVITAPIDEKAIRAEEISELPIVLANAKMDALIPVLNENESRIVVTADQVGRCNNMLLEKPESQQEFRERIPLFEKYGVELISALCVYNPKNNKRISDSIISILTFKKTTEEEVQKALDANDWNTCCAFNDTFVELSAESISTTYDCVKGMPLELLKKLIKKVS